MILIRRVEPDGTSVNLCAGDRPIYFLDRDHANLVVDTLNKVRVGKHIYEVVDKDQCRD